MESEQLVNLYMTGFGQFGSCKTNPTSDIINEIDLSPLEQIAGYKINVEIREVVDVDIDSVNSALDHIQDALQNHIEDGSRNLILHLGVSQGASEICLEKQALNVMNFSIPDMQGNQPMDEKIDKGEEIDHILHCKLNIDSICEKLKDNKHICSDSTDAGSYICNYTYYCSLREHQDIENAEVIFVHVPTFKTIPKEDQMECIIDIIKNWILG